MRRRIAYRWQNIALIIIGIIAVVTVLFNLFTPIGNNVRPLTLSEDVSVTDPAFIQTVSTLTNTPISSASSIKLINNGDAFMTSLLSDIRNAKEAIHLSNYIWEDGALANELMNALIAKQKEGVRVRLLVDANGGKRIPKDLVRQLTDAGGKVSSFRPGIPGKLTMYHMRLHRRAMIIDGSIAYTGGIGFADRWLGDARNPKEWRDTMVRVEGPVVSGIQSAFAELWTATSGEILIEQPSSQKNQKNTANTPETIAFESSPLEDIGLLSKFFTTSILAAKKSIYITTPYFIPDKGIRTALIQKAKEGVDVELILPNNLTDTKSVRFAGQSFYAGLLDAGVHIYEYQPTFIHSKYLVIDGVWSIVGSANMDNRSLYLNEENVLGVLDPNFGGVITERFMEDRSQSKEITKEEWKKRNIFLRIAQGSSRLFSQQF